jgi:hypothetical protein
MTWSFLVITFRQLRQVHVYDTQRRSDVTPAPAERITQACGAGSGGVG